MTKIEELEQKLNECQKALAYYKMQFELAELKESKKEGKWKPKDGEKYWIRNDEGEFDWWNWMGDKTDNWRYKNMPLFKTKEECERYWHFMDTVKEKSYSFSKEEWEDIGTMKWYISIVDGMLVVNEMKCTNVYGAVYFETKDDAQYIIDNFKDELMEYFV